MGHLTLRTVSCFLVGSLSLHGVRGNDIHYYEVAELPIVSALPSQTAPSKEDSHCKVLRHWPSSYGPYFKRHCSATLMNFAGCHRKSNGCWWACPSQSPWNSFANALGKSFACPKQSGVMGCSADISSASIYYQQLKLQWPFWHNNGCLAALCRCSNVPNCCQVAILILPQYGHDKQKGEPLQACWDLCGPNFLCSPAKLLSRHVQSSGSLYIGQIM